MIEIMNCYEAETSSNKCIGVRDYYTGYIAWLESQLTWRPVSYPPKEDGWYLCKVQYIDDTIGEEVVHFDGERFVFSNVIKWLPIPPAPEGEKK